MKKILICLVVMVAMLMLADSIFAEADGHGSWKTRLVLKLREKGIPKELIVIGISMLPIFELRGAIPVSNAVLDINWWVSFILAYVGNLIPIIPILLFLEPVSNWLRKIQLFDKFFRWLFARTRRRSEMVKRYEALGLILFVAIPLPVTGAWTGSIAAFIFGIKFWNAFLAIMMGVFIAGCIVTALTLMGIWGAIIAGLVLSALALSGFWKFLKERSQKNKSEA
jgi:uncharacterized membrane protein